MSKIALKPNESGTGVFTLAAPDSNADRTLTLPDEAGTVATIENIPPGYEDQDALDLFNVTGSAPVFACRAWVNFDGSGPTIRESGNVSSITDQGIGTFTVNFTNAMPDNEFAIFGTSNDLTGALRQLCAPEFEPTTTQVDIITQRSDTGTRQDNNWITFGVIR